jgi:hypothetical protein
MSKTKCVVVAVVLPLLATSSTGAQSLSEQAQCAAQARISANEENTKWETETRHLGYQTTTWDYESHYNTKLRKCFVVTKRMYGFGSAINQNTNLYDAFERRDFGLYSSSSRNPDKPMICQLLPTYGQTTYCKSEEEFKAFVASYMTE